MMVARCPRTPLFTIDEGKPLTFMHDILFTYIECRSGEKLTEKERDLILAGFARRKMRKRQYFLHEGEVCRRLGFIVSGSARMFSVDEKGYEHIIHLAMESWWLNDHESSINLTPSRYYIEMLEDSEVLIISVPDAHELRNKSRCFDLTIRALDNLSVVTMQNRLHAAIAMTSEERFANLSHHYPEFLKRFPMNMIASYLGLSPETLSRIRKNTRF
jgi:CRP-like cAMP-binding protein